MKKFALVVDDNDKYAKNLIFYLEKAGLKVLRALDAAEGWKLYLENKENLSVVITDITMESQTSGLWMIRKIHKDGFQGIKIIATTGFDVNGVMGLGKWILPWFAGISYMIPKVPLKSGTVQMIETNLAKGKFEDALRVFLT
ncbi:hypothetical protein CH373_18135 [Leptospira perolatii]|uniref:Response regulatory domain-containing protein n=1 Tax=Leptospira perolatii TaxID=2023191 RepID=A0A2M9ZI26_9LEPT|nr:response regulator [Leptospira perolatii]PJZ68060.1 hypothetical protein CH360_18115 [Leptospira perolatii]PJZ71710.1 hypothetical protein CH373_18135 [Leptospira perolatii]